MRGGRAGAAMFGRPCSSPRIALAVLAAAVFLALPAVAQDDDPRLTLAGQVELPRLVDLAAQRLRLSIDYDAQVLKGTVTLRLDEDLADAELWVLVNRVLAARGFTTVRAPGEGAYSVVRLADAPGLAPVVDGGPGPLGPAPGFRASVVRVRHRPARDLVEPLSKVLGRPSGSVTPLDESLLLLADLAPRVEQAESLLALLDRPAAAPVVEEIRLTTLTPAQMAAVFAQLVAKRRVVAGAEAPAELVPLPESGSVMLIATEGAVPHWRAVIADLDGRDRVETRTAVPRHHPAADVASLLERTVRPGADDRFRVVVDELTGSLIVTATPAQHEAVEAVLARLADAPPSARRPVRSFVVRNRSVREVQAILEDLVSAGVLEAADEEAPAPTGAPAVVPMPPPPADADADRTPPSAEPPRRPAPRPRAGEPPLVLTSDEGTNTLIAVGEPRLLAQVESLLRTLDVRQSQVMLEVLMVTLTDSEALDLGVEIEKLTSYDGVGVRLSSLFGLGVRGAGGALTGPDDGAGFTGVVLSPGDFSVVVRALQSVSAGRSLTAPRLLVGNNQAATLDAVVQQPFASVNASATVSTTSFGGTQDAGTVVTIRPQIAEGDHLVLQYSVSRSSFLGAAASPTLPPPRQQNRVQSVATIPDGYTVVVGGIDAEDSSRGVSQVPLLGDLPIVGEAFKSRRTSSTRSRFFVFIRATILRDRGFEDLKFLSDQRTTAAGVDDGWPEAEPGIIP